jgi:hypothetical protein
VTRRKLFLRQFTAYHGVSGTRIAGHAAPLGQDLANAELALATGQRFLQDAAPDD